MAQGDRTYTKLIAVLFAAGAVGVVAYSLVDQSKTMDRSQATLTLLQNASGGDADALATIADQFGTTELAFWLASMKRTRT